MARVQNGRDASLVVLSFLFASPFILPDDSFYHPVFYRSKSGLKRFLIGCPIRDNKESYFHLSANPNSRLYFTGIGKTLFRFFDQIEQV